MSCKDINTSFDLTHLQREGGKDSKGAALFFRRTGHQRGGLQVVGEGEVHHGLSAAWCPEGRQEEWEGEEENIKITLCSSL